MASTVLVSTPSRRIKGRRGERHFPRSGGKVKPASNSLLNRLAKSNYKKY
ncbi:MAG TPA: hypothetical protein VF077_08855 [Nitrospiraceae bacterium]